MLARAALNSKLGCCLGFAGRAGVKLALLSQPAVGSAKLLVFQAVAQVDRGRRASNPPPGKRATAQWHAVIGSNRGIRSRVSFEAETRPRFATGRKVAARREHGNAHGRSDKRIAKSHWHTIFVRFAACIGIREVAENGTTQGTDNPAWLQDAARASSAGRNSSAKSILLLVPAPLPQKSRHPGADLDMFRSRSRNARNDD